MVISSAIAASTRQTGPIPNFPLLGVAPDPFVAASPLVVGVVCRDGVLLVALHSIFSTDNHESSLFRKSYAENNHIEHTENRTNLKASAFQKDLPRSYRGPFRIYPLDASGTMAMVCAGWRTDCQILANHIRSIDKKEQLVFGNPISKALDCGSFLACQASLILAKFCVSERRRPLSCLGLLASGAGLWMVDSTGAYRVRAHAIGLGADKVNNQLRKKDWTQLECSAVKNELLQLLFDDSDHDNSNTNVEILKGSLIEMAIVEMSEHQVQRKVKRLFASV